VNTWASLEQDIVRNRELYQRMTAETFRRMWLMPNPRTGEPYLTESQFREVFRLFLDVQKGAAGPQPRLMSDKDVLLKALMDEGILPRTSGRGRAITDPMQLPDTSKAGAWWLELSEDLARWRQGNPEASDKDVREFVQAEIAKRKAEVYQEKSWLFRNKITGPEYRRRRGVDREAFEPVEPRPAGPVAPQRKPGDIIPGEELGFPGTKWKLRPDGSKERIE